jgi:flagellar biosynthetic protein FliR
MQELISLLNEEVVFNFLLLFARILAFVAFMPIFGNPAVSVNIRMALAFFITIFLFPIININTTFSQGEFVLALISEITLGLIASLFFNFVLSAVKIVGDFIGYSTALSMGTMFDPATGANEGFITSLLHWVALMIFFETGMYEMSVVMLVKSFSMVHLGTFDIFSYAGIDILINEVNRMFGFAIAIALPLAFIGFIIDIYYGYGTKSMPAFSPFVITFQLKFGLIFLFMILGMQVFAENFTNYMLSTFK